ncbi:hypothetical protein M427DRAFT_430961 [Gonapodya prolifera JEL478]|uniref:Uncharacterized protein n=1 Tax=Gonapodya prolifera (strain JEL478) TaxID=1344416 RepID=A0A139ASX4_GONPJ|nr:hypothetical protein M427DRAFT_430961 [Gonapodya prolifera JEL478]|eukprot:KXS19837.1 hypothetical protein M427DRAFT_430961 [Gonapodya prolifera JEL478]
MSLSETSTTSESPTATATPFPNRFQTEYSSLSLPFILVIALLTAAVLLAVGSVCGSWFWWRKRRGLEVCSVEAWCGNGAWGSDIARLLGRGRRRKRRKNHRETHLESPEDLASSQPEDEDDDDREPPPPAYPLSRSIEEPSQITPAITSEPPAISSPLTPVLATTDQPPVVSPTADVPPAITRNASAASLATLSSSSSSELDSSSTRQPTPDPNYPPPPTMLAFISPPTIPANSPYLDPVMHSQREIDDAVVAAAAEGDAYTARSKEQEAIEEGLPGWMARHPRGPKFARLLHRSRSAPPQSSYPTPLNLSHPLDLYPEEHALLTRLSQHVNPVDQGRTHPGWSGVTIHDGANVVFRKWDAARSAVGTEELVPESWLHLTTHPNGHPPATPNDDVHFSVLIAELGPQRLSEALRSRVSGADPANRQWSRGEGPAAAEARAAARAAGSGRPDHKVGETYPVMTETSTLSSGSNTAASASASDHYRLPSLESQSQSSLEAASATEEQHHPAAMSAQDLASDEPLPSESGSTPRLRGPAGVLRLAQQAARQASVTPSSSGAANHAPGSRGPTSSNGQQQTLGSSNLSQSLLASLTAATEASGDAEDPDAALARRLQREELSQLTRELERERENMARGRRKAVGGKFPHPVHVVVGLVTRSIPRFRCTHCGSYW